MKKIMLMLVVIATTALSASAQAPLATGGALLTFEKDLHDFGDIAQHDPAVVEFSFTNEGTEPLVLSQVKGSCTCTVPQWPKEPIMPGKTGTIKVKYDSKRVGPINKAVTIHSNDSEKPVKVIRIKGNVSSGVGNG